MSTWVQYNYPTKVLSGVNASHAIPNLLKTAGTTRPLVVMDRGLANLPVATEFMDMLQANGMQASLFSEIWGNPVKSQVMLGVQAYRQNQANAVIGFGGGAAMDVAKVIALMVNHPGDLFDYEDGKPDARPVNQPIPYMIMVATTAGTGSEVGRSSVISDDQTKVKKIIFDPQLLAKYAILDPTLTVNLPPGVTASTGLDALSHLVEAYLAKGKHPLADGIALEGMRILASSLRDCYDFAQLHYGNEAHKTLSGARLGSDHSKERHLQVREDMLNASMMGAAAFQKGLGVTHSMAHSLSTVCDFHHGLANGILMPHTMRFNARAVPERFVAMAKAVNAKTHNAAGFIAWLEELQRDLGVPAHLKDNGVTLEQCDALVHYAVLDGCHASNPCPVSEEDFRNLFHAAIGA